MARLSKIEEITALHVEDVKTLDMLRAYVLRAGQQEIWRPRIADITLEDGAILLTERKAVA